MSDRPAQSFANHARYVPPWHFICGPILLGLTIWAAVRLVQAPSADTTGDLLLMVALCILYVYARSFALRAQDRVIRLEEQLRFQRLFPPDLLPRIDEFTRSQYIALRFASDTEVAQLARTVLDEKITAQKQIKQMIRHWRPDHLRV